MQVTLYFSQNIYDRHMVKLKDDKGTHVCSRNPESIYINTVRKYIGTDCLTALNEAGIELDIDCQVEVEVRSTGRFSSDSHLCVVIQAREAMGTDDAELLGVAHAIREKIEERTSAVLSPYPLRLNPKIKINEVSTHERAPQPA